MVLALVLLLGQAAAVASLPALDSQGQNLPTLAPMIERVTPAVVNIATTARIQNHDSPLLSDPFFRRFFGLPEPRQQQAQSLGSGVIIDAARGYIVTNHHVIDKAEEISVTLNDGRTLSADLVGADPETDVAIIQVSAEALTALPLADSDTLRVGDFVVAIGNPFGLGQTVTSGIVSALGRSGLGIEGYEDFIQTDASINPGNSGGALVDLSGRLVGINTAIIAPGGGNVGIGFAIPVNMMQKIMNQLIDYGEVKRGRLGISVQELTTDLAAAFGIRNKRDGVVIAQIKSGSPAEKAGLQIGDIITKINDRDIRKTTELRNVLGLLRVDEQVKLQVLRNGKPLNVTAVIAAPKQVKMAGEQISRRLAGAIFATLDEQGSAGDRASAIVVMEVEPGSSAWGANLRPGDIITSINKQLVTSFADMKQAISRSERGILMNIQRGNMALFILIQ